MIGEQFLRDFRYAIRMLMASPLFSAMAVLSLALGIGANTAIYSFMDAILMRALPVHIAQGRVYLPADALRRHGTSPERVLARDTDEGLLALLTELRAKAREALDDAQWQVGRLNKRIRAAFLPLRLIGPYLAALEKQRDPLQEITDINPLYRLWRLLFER